MSNRREASGEKTDMVELGQRDPAEAADRLKVKVCEGLVSMQSNQGVIQVASGVVTACPQFDWLGEHSVSAETLDDGVVQHQILAHGTGGVVIEDQVSPLFADLGIVQSIVGGVAHEVKEAVFPFETLNEVKLLDGSALGSNVAESALRIEEGALIGQPSPSVSSIDVNVRVDDLRIEQGAFAISPAIDELSFGDMSPSIKVAKNTLVVENGMLVTSPTEKLLAKENSILGIDVSEGMLYVNQEQLSLSADYLGSSQLVLDTQEAITSIEWARIGESLGADILDRTRIQNNLVELSDSYSRLLVGAGDAHPGLNSLSPSLVEFPAAEYYHDVDVISRITSPWESHSERIETRRTQEHGELLSGEERLLAELRRTGEGLATMLRGAVYSLSSDNPDRIRHFSISMRELFSQVLHRLAPDDEISKWSVDESDYHNGRPTRSARIRYICREINQDSFERFVSCDVRSTLELLRLFHKGTHAPESAYTDGQLSAMRVRMSNAIRFLIEVSKV